MTLYVHNYTLYITVGCTNMAWETAESKAIQHLFDDLVVSCTGIATQLFSNELISQTTLRYTSTIGLTDDLKATKMLFDIQTAIRMENKNFDKFVHVLQNSRELIAMADKLVTCRDKIRSETSCNVSPTRGDITDFPSSIQPSVSSVQTSGKHFVATAGMGATFGVSKRLTGMAPPQILALNQRGVAAARKGVQDPILSSPPTPMCRPVPCTEGEAPCSGNHPRQLDNETNQIHVRQLEEAFAALRIDTERKLSEKDLVVNELALRCRELRELCNEWQIYALELHNQLECSTQDCSSLEAQVLHYKEELESVERSNQMEQDLLKRQLKQTKEEFLVACCETQRPAQVKRRTHSL